MEGVKPQTRIVCSKMAEQEQIAQGSLGSSHRNTHAIVLKRATQQQQEKAIAFLNSTRMDLVIQQRLSEKAEVPLKRGTFFLHSYPSKIESGFIVLLEDNPPIFLRYNLSKKERERSNQPVCNILRLRTSAAVNEGTVLVASIDTVNHKMYLEDVHIWRNDYIFARKTFIERRTYMKDFVEKHWISDVRLLGGIITEVIQPMPLASYESLLSEKNYMKIVFLPNSPGKRRFTFALNETVARIGEGFYGRADDSGGRKPPPLTPCYEDGRKPPTPCYEDGRKSSSVIGERKPNKSEEQLRNVTQLPEQGQLRPLKAKAIRVPMLPDVYELYTIGDTTTIADNFLGRGCVQDLALSKLLNTHGKEIDVQIAYTTEFKRYEIVGLYTS